MKTSIIGLFIFTISVKWSLGQNFEAEQEIMNLSKEKWLWMSDKNADKLDTLFHPKAMFDQMGGSWGKEQGRGYQYRLTFWFFCVADKRTIIKN
jgi:hypothetical protein